ncbi:MAG: Gfo/Idh/MocA family protein, partial [Burkholderiales bacterium]
MKSLIVGLGSIGRRHGRNLTELGVNVLGVDPRQDRRDAFAAEIKGAKTYEKLDEGLAAGCDFAVVASPNVFHLEQALTCAQAGMHLFIEKPLAVSLDGMDALTEAVEERRLTVLMGSNWKFHPGLRRMKELIDSKAIGRVLAVQAIGGQYLPDWHPWEDYHAMYSSRVALGGGVLWDSHDMDYLTWLAGPLSAVSCRTARTRTLDIETEDLACALLTFKSGAQGTLQMDYLQRPYARRVHVTGSLGTVVWEYPEGAVRHYHADDKTWRTYPVPEGYELNQMYVDEM